MPIDVITSTALLARIAAAVETETVTSIATVNAEYVVRAAHDPRFRTLLTRTAINTADGHGVVWALRRRGRRLERRVGGSDLVWDIPEQAAIRGHRLFLLGAAPGVAGVAAERLRARFPGLCIAGTYAGSPAPREEEAIVDLIRRARADIVLVAYGSPEQDVWIERNLPRTGAAVAMGVGGSLDYVAGLAVRAPRWMQDHGLEWLWRLAREPWRWRRMLALPRFVWLAWRAERWEAMERTTGE